MKNRKFPLYWILLTASSTGMIVDTHPNLVWGVLYWLIMVLAFKIVEDRNQ